MSASQQDTGIEFDCIECGAHIYSPIPDPESRCAGCRHVASIIDEDNRAELRAYLMDRGIIGRRG
jgi:hypothetical protein